MLQGNLIRARNFLQCSSSPSRRQAHCLSLSALLHLPFLFLTALPLLNIINFLLLLLLFIIIINNNNNNSNMTVINFLLGNNFPLLLPPILLSSTRKMPPYLVLVPVCPGLSRWHSGMQQQITQQ